MIKFNAKQLRTTEVDPKIARSIKKNPITIILDNVLDTYNVGSIFRLADAIAAEKVYLCGETLTPPNSRIKKASINTWQWVDWQYASTAGEAIAKLKTSREAGSRSARQNSPPKADQPLVEKLKIIAVEQDKRSKPFDTVQYEFPLAIVVGHETNGVSKEVLDIADMIVELPMWGINKSLNVMVSCGIILYEIMNQKSNQLAQSG